MTEQDKKPKKSGWFARLSQGLARTSSALGDNLSAALTKRRLDEATLDDIEEVLIKADFGLDMAERIRAKLAETRAERGIAPEAVRELLAIEIAKVLKPLEQPLEAAGAGPPAVFLVVGVNGTGKTTTIGKLAHRFKKSGQSVLLAAGDTFRAAAVEQLQVWGERNNVPVVAQQPGADPAAVIFDAWVAANARKIDVLLADTAGRLQSQTGLMDELGKMKRVVGRQDETAPHETMLVLDASQGQNALVQAEKFHETIGLTGITVTKLDGTAKGGILLSIANRLKVPVRFIGIGEAAEDMQPFSAGDFVTALLLSNDSRSDGFSSEQD